MRRISTNSLVRGYYFVFYKLYRFSEVAPRKGLSDWTASVCRSVLLMWVLASLFAYYNVFIDRHARPGDSILPELVVAVAIAEFNYRVFHHERQWKSIFKAFDKLDKRKSRAGGWIVLGVVALILGNLVFSIYLMSRIDRNLYR